MSQNLYRDLHASLLRFCSDFSTSFSDNVPSFINFDAAGDENSLPASDIIGPLALSFELDDHLLMGTVQIGYSTWGDANLFRLVERVDTLLELLKPTCRINVYDATGEVTSPKGFIVIQNGTHVMPVIKGDTRPIQFIAIHFMATNTFKDAEALTP
jgi:hypothetical protein